MWACEVLREKLLFDMAVGRHAIMLHDGALKWFDVEMSLFKAIVVAMPMDGCDGLLLDAWQFLRRNAGSKVWWSLSTLHSSLGLRGVPSAWYHRSWVRWSRWLSQLCLDEPHLRRAVATSQSSQPAEFVRAELDKPVFKHRLLPAYSASTVALLALLTKWSLPHSFGGRSRDDAYYTSFERFGTSLMELVCAGKTIDLVCVLGLVTLCYPGLRPQGLQRVTLVIENGFVDMTPVVDSGVEVAQSLAAWCNISRPVFIMDLLRALLKVGRSGANLFKQILMQVGDVLESFCLSCVVEGSNSAACPVSLSAEISARSQQRLKRKLVDRLAQKLEQDVELTLLKYFHSGHQAFSGAQALSIACDLSRVSKRETACSVLCLPNNTAMIGPPQARQ